MRRCVRMKDEKGEGNMGARVYLERVRRMDAMVKAKLEERAEIRAKLYSITAGDFTRERVRHGGLPHDRMAVGIGSLMALERALSDEIVALCALKAEVARRIAGLSDAGEEDAQLVLTLRYLNGKTWEAIAEDMGFSAQWVHVLHKRAIARFEEKYFLRGGVDCN